MFRCDGTEFCGPGDCASTRACSCLATACTSFERLLDDLPLACLAALELAVGEEEPLDMEPAAAIRLYPDAAGLTGGRAIG